MPQIEHRGIILSISSTLKRVILAIIISIFIRSWVRIGAEPKGSGIVGIQCPLASVASISPALVSCY
jgi:hypothetical protein